MKRKYDYLKKQYPEYISLDQLRVICNVAKRTARYLLQNNIIPSIDTGKRTWRYKIAIDDVINYLQYREQSGSMIPRGAVSSRSHNSHEPRHSFSTIITQSNADEVYRYFEYIYIEYSDIFTANEIVDMTGLSHKTILELLKNGTIKSITNKPKYIVPKTYLFEFVSTSKYFDIKSNSEMFKKILGGFEIWKSKGGNKDGK